MSLFLFHVTEIAHLLARSKSTISRELRRNAAPCFCTALNCVNAPTSNAGRPAACISDWRMHHWIPTSRPVSWSIIGR